MKPYTNKSVVRIIFLKESSIQPIVFHVSLAISILNFYFKPYLVVFFLTLQFFIHFCNLCNCFIKTPDECNGKTSCIICDKYIHVVICCSILSVRPICYF